MPDKIKEVNSVLNHIPFENIIGGPLVACVEAQDHAARASSRYMREVGFSEDETTKELHAEMVHFVYEHDGVMNRLSVPLITIVPLPYIKIENVNLSFVADVSVDEDGQLLGRVSTDQVNAESEQNNQFSYQSQFVLNIDAGVSDAPVGVSRLLQVLGETIFEDIEDEEDVPPFAVYPEVIEETEK